MHVDLEVVWNTVEKDLPVPVAFWNNWVGPRI